jgi:hypothetical protein
MEILSHNLFTAYTKLTWKTEAVTLKLPADMCLVMTFLKKNVNT